jgi:hypothetical protein
MLVHIGLQALLFIAVRLVESLRTLPACPSDKGCIETEVYVENCKHIPQIEEVEVTVRQWLESKRPI